MGQVSIERALNNAVASTNMEGFDLGEDQKELLRQIITGKKTLEEAIEQIRRKYNG